MLKSSPVSDDSRPSDENDVISENRFLGSLQLDEQELPVHRHALEPVLIRQHQLGLEL